jgi:hypothetical protein
VTRPGWRSALEPLTTFDAIVSTTALHWIELQSLAAFYAEAVGLLRPGGVFVNGDHMAPYDPPIADLAKAAERGRVQRAGVTGNEEWAAWWTAIAGRPRARRMVGGARAARLRHGYGNGLTVADHETLLRRAGFAAVGPLWQCGTDHVLAARGGRTAAR